MKEATGELNMTVITLVAIAAIGAVFYFLVWPLVQRTLATNSCRTAYGTGYNAVRMEAVTSDSQAQVNDWSCVWNPDDGAANTSAEGMANHALSNGADCNTGGGETP